MLHQLEEGEQRLAYALHYGIPYPRLHHASQFHRRYVLDTPETELGQVPQARQACKLPAPLASTHPQCRPCDAAAQYQRSIVTG